jgi:hypothetical protein
MEAQYQVGQNSFLDAGSGQWFAVASRMKAISVSLML